MFSRPKIVAFWDLDTCPPPPQLPASDIMRGIREFTSSLGVITSIKVYWNSKAGTDTALIAFRTELVLLGVSVVDSSVIKGLERDAVTRMLTADAFTAALDQPEDQKTSEKIKILILSTDSGILYPISLLHFRDFEIYLVIPDENHLTPEDRVLFYNVATKIVTWTAILGPTKSSNATKQIQTNQVHELKPHSEQQRTKHDGSTWAEGLKSELGESAFPLTPSLAAQSLISKYGVSTQNNSRKPTPKTSTIPTPASSAVSTQKQPSSKASGKASQPAERLSSPAMKAQSISEQSQAKRKGKGRDRKPSNNPKTTTEMDMTHLWNEADAQAGVALAWGTALEKADQSGSGDKLDIPAHFEPLIQILRKARKEGKESVMKSAIGGPFNERKNVFISAGVKNFREYIALAEEKRLVVLRGSGKETWVALGPAIR